MPPTEAAVVDAIVVNDGDDIGVATNSRAWRSVRRPLVDDSIASAPAAYLCAMALVMAMSVAALALLRPWETAPTAMTLLFAVLCGLAGCFPLRLRVGPDFDCSEVFCFAAFALLTTTGSGQVIVCVVVAVGLVRPAPSWARQAIHASTVTCSNVCALGAAILMDHLVAGAGPVAMVLAAFCGMRVWDVFVSLLCWLRWRDTYDARADARELVETWSGALCQLTLPVAAVALAADSPAIALALPLSYLLQLISARRNNALVDGLEHTKALLERGNLQFAVAMVCALDARDAYTARHSAAVAVYSRDLARALGLDDDACRNAFVAGMLHDIGKIGVRSAVLDKNGRLTEPEFDEIKRHPDIGADILGMVEAYSDMAVVVRHHHERVDGRGYPATWLPA